MMTTIQTTHLFDAPPQRDMLKISSETISVTLMALFLRIKEKIGAGKMLRIYPHRVVKQYWSLDVEGENGKLPILLNITGRFRLPDLVAAWPARLVIDVSDHIDAYWFAIFLAQQLNLSICHPSMLSTGNGDNIVSNQGENEGDAR